MKQNLTVGAVLVAAILMLFGATQADAQSAEDNPAEVEAGKTVYESSCAGCHSADGTGSSRGRPLTGIASQGDRATHIMSVTDGKGNMPAFGERLSGEQIGAALSYVRLTFVEAAAETTSTDDDASTELAVTGTETPLVAVGGVTLLAAGVLMVHYTRRETEAAA